MQTYVKKNIDRFIIIAELCSQLVNGFSVPRYKVPAKSDREPVDKLNDRHEADSKAKAAKTSEVGDEVKPGHLWGSLKLCETAMN